MEESRLVYEDATHQLGSFLGSVSNQLTGLNIRQGNNLNSSATTQNAVSLQFASERHSSVNVTSQESSPSAGSVTHVTTSYIKSSHRGNNKSLNRKRGQQINEIQGYSRRTRSIDLDVNHEENINSIQKKWSSDTHIKKIDQEDNINGELKLGNIVKKMKNCFKMEKRSGKFSINKSTKEMEQKYTEPLSTTIIGFHGIWSLRNY